MAAAAARRRAAGEGQRGRGRSKGDPGFSTPGGARLRGGKEEPGRVCRQVWGGWYRGRAVGCWCPRPVEGCCLGLFVCS